MSGPSTTTLRGIGVGRGIAVGPTLRMADPLPAPSRAPSTVGADKEKERLAAALASTAAEIRARALRAGGSGRDVLEAQALMVEDPTLRTSVDAAIETGATAETAVHEAFKDFRDLLAAMGGYMAERAADLTDVSQRVVAMLTGVAVPGVPQADYPFILVARDLAPAETVLLDLTKVLAVVTSDGGPTSHTAILAREKSIVAVVGAQGAESLSDGTTVIVDARSGAVLVSPSAAELDEAMRVHDSSQKAAVLVSGPGALADGTLVPLLANLGSPAGAARAIELGAEGIGLFRTEFLFLDSEHPPTIDEQVKHYHDLFSAFPHKKVIVRVLDAGADKPLKFLNDSDEENPALGLRGIRALRAHEEILRDQLTAIALATAASTAEVWVMAPMIATVEETRYFTSLARELGVRVAGAMIEVPAAALLADRIMAVADFVSIGTNDLTQYTFAADRLLGSVAAFQDPWHPAILRLIKQIGSAGVAASKPVGICGEAAAEPLLAVVLVGLGATSLSMSPSALADVRTELAQFTLAQAQDFAELALSAESAAEARDKVLAAISTITITPNTESESITS